MLNTRKYTAWRSLAWVSQVAAATPVPAKAYWFGWGWAVLRLRRLPPVRLRMRLPARLRSVLPALPILSAYAYAGYFPRYRFYRPMRTPVTSRGIDLIGRFTLTQDTGRCFGIIDRLTLMERTFQGTDLSGCALLVVGRPQPKTADWPHKRRATSAVTSTALV